MQVHSNGISLEFDTFGPPTGKPLLLISGLNTPMTRWTPAFCEKLVKEGFYVIRYDNRDCGLSTHLDNNKTPSNLTLLSNRLLGLRFTPPYSLMEMVRDAIGLLVALGIDSAHICGRSMGGVIAQMLASTYPEKVKSLTIIMSTTGNRMLPMPSMRVLKHMLMKKPNPFVELAGYLEHRVAYTQAIGSKRYPLDTFFVRSRVMDDIKRSGFHPGAARRQMAALLHSGDIRGFTRKITAPTLVIHGDSDGFVPKECGIDVYRNIPGSRLKIIKDMGHALQPEFFEELVDEITTHVKEFDMSINKKLSHNPLSLER